LLLAGLDSQPVAGPRIDPTEPSPQAASSGFTPPAPEELAAHFPQLEILELLGRGGMGAVYKARQPGLDRLVALKILPREVHSDSAFAERFTREARALARLNHPNIVAVYDFGRTGDGLFYFVMEYVDGVNLRQAIEAGGMSPKDALAIVPQICDALQFAHDEGIVHRDIKPENILVDKRGRVKIADFGLAKLLGQEAADQQLTGTQQVMGTLRYMAPEQMEGSKSVDHRADIYSLGVVFYELLTGELPIGRFAPPSKKVQIDVRLDEVVLRALEKEPEQRYQQVSELKTEVESVTLHPAPAKAFRPEPAATRGATADHALDAAAGKPFIEPRLSRCALWGAIWVPLGFLLAALAFAFLFVSGVVGWYTPNWGLAVPAILGLLLSGSTPFGTTILGVVAIRQIKRSKGRLYGLPLAVFDVVVFPLLLLDLVVLAAGGLASFLLLFLTLSRRLDSAGVTPIVGWGLILLLDLLLVAGPLVWLNRRIIRGVWRNATGYQAPPKPAAAILPQPSAKPGYVKWVFVPMLVLFALWLAVSAVTIARYGHGKPGNDEPRSVMEVEELGLLLLVLALPVLLLLRWMRTLPKAVRSTLAKRLTLSTVSLVLAVLALLVYFMSPWNTPHVEEHAMTFLPASKAYSRLEIDVRFFSVSRTAEPYRKDDQIEMRLKTYASNDLLQSFTRIEFADGQLTWHKPAVVWSDQPNHPKTTSLPEKLTRETFLDWLKSNPAGREEAEELWRLLEYFGPDKDIYRWEDLVAFAKDQLHHFNFGEDLGTKSYITLKPSPAIPIVLLMMVLGFLSAVFASIWFAIVQRKRLSDRPPTA
jgi:predicted Ser/Thr protein kinase